MEKSQNILTLMVENSLTPAEAVDYLATEKAGYTQREWSEKRGLDDDQSVGRNVRQAHQKLSEPKDIIETVIVDGDDVVEALKYQGSQSSQDRTSAVLRIHPPFENEAKASIYYAQEGNFYPPEMDPKPIHLHPSAFVGDTMREKCPDRGVERTRVRDEFDDLSDDEIEEHVETVFDVWENQVRDSFREETDINGSYDETHVVEVRYE